MTQESNLTEAKTFFPSDSEPEMDTEMMTTAANVLASMGEFGQIGIVWFSMGVALWQLLVIGKSLLTAGRNNTKQNISRQSLHSY